MDIFGSILGFIQSPFTIISVVFWIIAFTLYLILGRKKKFVTFLFPFVALFRWKVFNKFFARVARRHKKLWKIWWNIGIVVSFAFMLLTLYFFISNLLQLIIDPKPENAIMPLIPGVTISLPMFSQFLLPILITVTIHEFSHAIAAETDGVNVKSSGIMGGGLFFILGFGAFVEVDDFQLYSSKFKTGTRLRVYAAGVWSNIILAGILFLIINFYPAISSIAYTGQSDRITSVLSQDAGGFNENNIEIGDIIYQINGTIADSNKGKGLSNVLANETALSIKPGDTLNLTCWDAKNNSYYGRNIVLGFRSFAGIAIQKVSNSEFNVTTVYPALNGGNNENNIPVGTIIKSFNNTLVDYANHQTFEKFLSTHEPNYTVNLTAVNGTSYEIQVNYFPKAPGAYIFKDIFLGLNYQQLSVNSVKITNVFKNNTEYGINEKHIEENTVITAVNGIHLDLSNQTFAEFIETEINPQSGDVLTFTDENDQTYSILVGEIPVISVYVGITSEDYWVARNWLGRLFGGTFPIEFRMFLLYTFMISFSLALFNLLPTTIFDGGRMFKELIEKIIGTEKDKQLHTQKIHMEYDDTETKQRILKHNITQINSVKLMTPIPTESQLYTSLTQTKAQKFETSTIETNPTQENHGSIPQQSEEYQYTDLQFTPISQYDPAYIDAFTLKETFPKKTILEVEVDYEFDIKEKTKKLIYRICSWAILGILLASFAISIIKFNKTLFWLN